MAYSLSDDVFFADGVFFGDVDGALVDVDGFGGSEEEVVRLVDVSFMVFQSN